MPGDDNDDYDEAWQVCTPTPPYDTLESESESYDESTRKGVESVEKDDNNKNDIERDAAAWQRSKKEMSRLSELESDGECTRKGSESVDLTAVDDAEK